MKCSDNLVNINLGGCQVL